MKIEKTEYQASGSRYQLKVAPIIFQENPDAISGFNYYLYHTENDVVMNKKLFYSTSERKDPRNRELHDEIAKQILLRSMADEESKSDSDDLEFLKHNRKKF